MKPGEVCVEGVVLIQGGIKKGDKIHGQKKGKKGEAAAYVTRAQAGWANQVLHELRCSVISWAWMLESLVCNFVGRPS